MKIEMTQKDRLGLVHPTIDSHTLGISSIAQILEDCGFAAVIADTQVCDAFGSPEKDAKAAVMERWIRENRITLLGFSYRLDPRDGAAAFGRMVQQLRNRRLTGENGGPIRGLCFAGLPGACKMVREQFPDVAVFEGDETAAETVELMGIPRSRLPAAMVEGAAYDEDRMAFGRELIRKADYLSLLPADRGGYPQYGRRDDSLIARLDYCVANKLGPLMRAHVGPYLPNRDEAVKLFLDWSRQLAAAGHLDVLSVGTSQLTQSNFGEDWTGRPNGGGVPVNSVREYAEIWDVSRPMLVRTYAGTKDIPGLARIHEETINIAWHALSLWWFCRIDGRGPYAVRENLRQHVETLKYIASTGKPFEPNVPHHFAFRGADDVTYVVSAVLAARLAKSLGIRCLVLQNMLNTPKYTWGIQDLAKSRAMLRLVRELEDENFCVVLQPRGGLDYFSPDLDKARAQLAAVAALMDDIEPDNLASPQVIHVVSYSEASHLADPAVVNESIQITRHAITEWRRLRKKGDVADMSKHKEVLARTESLAADAREVLVRIESIIPQPYTADGLYQIFAAGFLPVPYLWECREEFHRATAWRTRVIRGAVEVVDDDGRPMKIEDRMHRVVSSAGLIL